MVPSPMHGRNHEVSVYRAGPVLARGEPEVSWPARGFGPRWNSWDSPQVDQATLLALLAHLLIVGHGATAFHLDPDGVVSVLDEEDRVRRLSPDRDGLYDLVSLDCVCHRCAPAARAVMA